MSGLIVEGKRFDRGKVSRMLAVARFIARKKGYVAFQKLCFRRAFRSFEKIFDRGQKISTLSNVSKKLFEGIYIYSIRVVWT